MAVGKNTKAKGTNKNIIASLINVFKEYKAEMKRITWPTKDELKKAIIAVAVLCSIYIVYVGILDSAFKSLFDLIFNK